MQQEQSVNNKQLTSEYFVSYSPSLARLIGRNEAIFLNHLHYWFSQTTSGRVIDGKRFVYNTLEQWIENLDMSVKTLQRTIKKLVDLDLLDVKQLAQANRTKFYAINYKALEMLMPRQTSTNETSTEKEQEGDKVTCPTGQSDRFNTYNTQKLQNTPHTCPDRETEPDGLDRPASLPSGKREEEEGFLEDIEFMETEFLFGAPQPDLVRTYSPGHISSGKQEVNPRHTNRQRGQFKQPQQANQSVIERLKNWKPSKQQLERKAWIRSFRDVTE